MAEAHIRIDVSRLARLTGLEFEAAATLLGTRRTRTTLYVLSRCDSPVTIDRLARAIARRSTGTDTDTDPSSARLSLVHVTLPKLEDYGVIEYELAPETVRVDGPVVGLERPLGAAPDEADDSEPGRSNRSTDQHDASK
ncbi:hypothetical protein GS429_20855 [Natronorubrum sp. JWXQ-INN-674]|uniref:DUF7344 domain-containing protein n=1 Tax=Natronorubrum halalkaliphilum TaxID=2691917 RepID=A0A6B0VSN4_9EURY|nr:hypothetical protein [Natronorubrum halalkaliphilum]MXV64474.1 hypothetical protein [Natronorubrum halalkaliphilum]